MSEKLGEFKDTPIVLVDRVESSGNPTAIIDECPVCGDTHTHGFTGVSSMCKDTSSLSHRSAHCTGDTDNYGYWLVYTGETEGVECVDNRWQVKATV